MQLDIIETNGDHLKESRFDKRQKDEMDKRTLTLTSS